MTGTVAGHGLAPQAYPRAAQSQDGAHGDDTLQGEHHSRPRLGALRRTERFLDERDVACAGTSTSITPHSSNIDAQSGALRAKSARSFQAPRVDQPGSTASHFFADSAL